MYHKYDHLSAVISVYAGVGGEDAADWSKMLLDMYISYAKRRNWKVIRKTRIKKNF